MTEPPPERRSVVSWTLGADASLMERGRGEIQVAGLLPGWWALEVMVLVTTRPDHSRGGLCQLRVLRRQCHGH